MREEMAADSAMESKSKDVPYCRKQKSLGLLCINFLSLYNRAGVETVGLDDAAIRLGVERRRIYDIVNVLESVGLLARKAKNLYSWKGFGAVPKALQGLKKEGLKDSGATVDSYYEKMDMISLDHAAKLLLGDGTHILMSTRTKVRRLYDIVNVLSSMNFIEKIHDPETRKPAFKWLGLNGKPDNGTSDSAVLNQFKKRTFGTDLSNATVKRPKVDGDSFQVLKSHNPVEVKCEIENEIERTRIGEKSFQFGPFAPAYIPKVGTSHDVKGNGANLESLALTYHPQYHNQALKDLFSHYVEAWKSWYSEVVGKNPLNIMP